MKEIWCIGSVNWDQYCIEDVNYEFLGGSAANTAFYLAEYFSLMDINVELVSIIGMDSKSLQIIKALNKTKIMTTYLDRLPGKSGNPLITLINGERKIERKDSVLKHLPSILNSFVRYNFADVSHIHANAPYSSLILISSWNLPSFSLDMSGLIPELKILKQDHYSKFHFNFPARINTHHWKKIVKHLNFQLKPHILFGNAAEFEELAKIFEIIPPNLPFIRIARRVIFHVMYVIQQIFQADIVIMKRGFMGSFAISENLYYDCAALSIKTLDSTGAGDAFNAGFLASYLQKRSIRDALISGTICGGLVCENLGAQTKNITLDVMKEKWSFVKVTQKHFRWDKAKDNLSEDILIIDEIENISIEHAESNKNTESNKNIEKNEITVEKDAMDKDKRD